MKILKWNLSMVDLKRIFSVFLLALFVLNVVSTTMPIANAAETEKSVLDTRISIDVQDADLRGVLKGIAESFNLNIVTSEDVKGAVTISLKEVKLGDALDLMLSQTGYVYKIKDNVIVVTASENELVTEIVSVTFVKPSEIKATVQAFASPKGSIEAVDEENRLIIKEMPSKMAALLEQIKKMDHAPKQIMIETRMIEIEVSDLSALGVVWQGNQNLKGVSEGTPASPRTFVAPGVFSPTSTTNPTSTTSSNSQDFRLNMPETSSDLSGGQLNYGLTWGHSNMSATIDALLKKSNSSLLASPTIATMDGQEARIIIGEKFPFRENTLTAVGTTETTKFIDIGTALRVTPRVMGDDNILLDIHPEVSSLNVALEAGPRIDTREATTKVLVKNGETVVIAGLIRHDKSIINQKVPFFGNLPLIGLAFRNKSTKLSVRELAVFITPYLMTQQIPDPKVKVVDEISPMSIYKRATEMLEEFGVESFGMPEEQRYRQASALFKSIIRNFPTSAVADASAFELAKLYTDKFKNYPQASEMLNLLMKNYPASSYLKDKNFNEVKRMLKIVNKHTKK